jgi:hypothetical protein
MAIQTVIKTRKEPEFELRVKAKILDELMELIEENLLGYFMKISEKEKNIPLSKAKKLLS